MSLDEQFWRGRSVFLTGHTGFKGAWLCLLLHRLGARVHGYSLAPPTTPNLFDLADCARLVEGTQADIRDPEALTRAMQQAKPDVVMHLAAQSLVRPSYAEPSVTFAVNVTGTVNVLEAIRATPSVSAAVIVTTDKVYDLALSDEPRKETDPLGGHDPYSASKAAAEIVTQSYRQSFFAGAHASSHVEIATVRSGNVIGGGDWSVDRIVTDIVRALPRGQPVELRYPNAVRPWLFVLDTLVGYLLLAERLAAKTPGAATAWNFGPPLGEEMRVRDLVDAFSEAMGSSCSWRQIEALVLPEAPVLRLDPTRARTELGWRPTLDQRSAVKKTAEWFACFLGQSAGASALCNDAIDRQLARLSGGE